LTILVSFFFSENISAQVDTTEILNDKIFQYLEEATEDKDDSQLYELFDELLSNPIDLNNASKGDLLKLPFIPEISVKRILRFIKKKKGIKSFDELYQIKNVDPNVLLLLKPFVKIYPKERENKKNNYFISRSRLLSNINDKEEFLSNKYLGNKLKSYQRIKAGYNNFRSGFLVEKDAGEKSFTDFYSGYVQYNTKGIFNNIIVGDYILEFGQGLAVWSPYSFSKGSDATNSLVKS